LLIVVKTRQALYRQAFARLMLHGRVMVHIARMRAAAAIRRFGTMGRRNSAPQQRAACRASAG
jgi:hypothetical protein